MNAEVLQNAQSLHITITIIELKYFLPCSQISLELLVIAISDTSTILRKRVPNIYIQIQGMFRKPKRGQKKKLCQKSIQAHFRLSHDSREKNVFDGIFNEYLCVLVSFTCHCVLVRFTGSFQSISEHILQFDTHMQSGSFHSRKRRGKKSRRRCNIEQLKHHELNKTNLQFDSMQTELNFIKATSCGRRL